MIKKFLILGKLDILPTLYKTIYTKIMTPEMQAQREIVNRHDVIRSLTDAKIIGIEDREIDRLCYRVSKAVDDNNEMYPGVMLPKTPEDIYNQLSEGSGCMIISEGHGQWEFLHFNARYNLFSGDNELGSVHELGSLITDIKYRGHGLATIGAEYQMEYSKEDNKDAVIIATIKGATAAHTLLRAGFDIISFQRYPDLAALTCTCISSEVNSPDLVCKYRRSYLKSKIDTLQELTRKIMNKEIKHPLPCTLLAAGSYDKFQERCKKIHEQNNRIQGINITNDTFLVSGEIFNK